MKKWKAKFPFPLWPVNLRKETSTRDLGKAKKAVAEKRKKKRRVSQFDRLPERRKRNPPTRKREKFFLLLLFVLDIIQTAASPFFLSQTYLASEKKVFLSEEKENEGIWPFLLCMGGDASLDAGPFMPRGIRDTETENFFSVSTFFICNVKMNRSFLC